ncbi:GntR family transcriptional regulator [Ramlibacter sp. G-1-2-2]|uniref:GntR family transcriptional regulator n=1 Tax=Ramlibacter agri TaxID=2728837 RepID=A0A848HBU5_9BURK|nr:GntR family transcriptional regulator [Ramlibacter agri]NML46969.1 GntR family transcriptional regulator [Ramlibacter agri]
MAAALAPAHRPKRLDRTRQAAPQVFERLREMIIALELAPGTVLARADLATMFGVSQTPVRDALIKLSEEGLVDIFPQHATHVSRIDVASALQAHFLRRAIELEVVDALARKPTELLLAQLRAQLEIQQALAGGEDYDQFIAADREFHRLMYVAAGVPDLYDLVCRRSGHVDRLRRLHLPSAGKARAVVRDHKRVLEAIAAGQPGEARERLREHLSGTLAQVDRIRAEHPDFVV